MSKIKIKSNRAAAKRFKKTKSGIFKRGKAYKSHILTKKAKKRKEIYVLTQQCMAQI